VISGEQTENADFPLGDDQTLSLERVLVCGELERVARTLEQKYDL